MNVIDSSGWLEFLAGSDAGKYLLPLVQKPLELVVPSITIFEVFKKVTHNVTKKKPCVLSG